MSEYIYTKSLKDIEKFYSLLTELIAINFKITIENTSNLKIVFDNVLSEEQENTLNNFVNNYENVELKRIFRSEILNIYNTNVSSLEYVSIADNVLLIDEINHHIHYYIVYIIPDFKPINQINYNNAAYYKIKLYNKCDNLVIYESGELSVSQEEIYKLCEINSQNVCDMTMEVQLKVSDVNYVCNIKLIKIVYYKHYHLI